MPIHKAPYLASQVAVSAERLDERIRPLLESAERLPYPESRRVDQVDDHHGVQVADPYRWLEDLDADETRSWIAAQNRVTAAWLGSIPERAGIRKRLTELWNYERFGMPVKDGGRYFFVKNDGLQNQNVLYTMATQDAPPRLLLDPNELSPDGTVALICFVVSPGGRYVAYGLASGGSDWQEWRVRDVDTGCDLPDHLKWVKFSRRLLGAKRRGLLLQPLRRARGRRPVDGTTYLSEAVLPSAGDSAVRGRADLPPAGRPGDGLPGHGHARTAGTWSSTSGRGRSAKNAVFYKDLSDPGSPVVELLPDFDATYNFVGNEGPLFWFQTDLDAPRGRVIAIDSATRCGSAGRR